MTQRSYPHSTTPLLTEAEWANLARHWYGTGVLRDELNQFANNTPSGLGIGIQSGRSYVDGVWHESDAVETKTVATNSGVGNPRTDRIALKLNRSTKTVEIVVVPGTAASGGPVPTLVDTADEIYSKLFQVKLNANSSSINTVVDEREFAQPLIVRRLGIGTKSPVAALDVLDPDQQGFVFRGNYAAFRIFDGSGTAQVLFGLRPDVSGNSEHAVVYTYTGDIRFYPAGTESVRFGALSSDVAITVLNGDIDIQNGKVLRFDPTATVGTATGGSATLPANPQSFLKVKIGGIEKKIPYYNT